jgi:AcrR family transcriptional regulator
VDPVTQAAPPGAVAAPGPGAVAPRTPGARGRPRSERCRAAVLEAAAGLLAERGMDAVTMEAIAARARVSKATVYKWWPSRAHVVLEAFFDRTRETTRVPQDATLAEALTTMLTALTVLVRDGVAGALLSDLIGAAQRDPAIRDALEEHWVRPRREVTEGLLREAVQRGDLPADTDVPAAVDQLYAPVYYRLLLRHEPLGDELPGVLVRQLLTGLRPAPDTRAETPPPAAR